LSIIKSRAMAQARSHRPLLAEARVRFRKHARFVVDKVALAMVASPVSIIPPRPAYMMLLPGQMGKAWEPSKKQSCFGNQKHWREKS